MDSLQSQSQGTICSSSSSNTADSSSFMDADQGIIEPRLGSNNFSEISARIGLQGWLSADNGVGPNKCHILVTWNPTKLMVQILDHAPQWLVCETTMLATNKKLLITFIHGFNTPAERVQLWDHLVGRCSVNKLVPWLAIGDFNAILSGEDRVGGSQRWPQHMEDFPVCIQQAGLSSLPYTGQRFTWSNGQTGTNANSALLQAWPAAHANFLPRLVSDHSPMTINLAQESKAHNKPFHFLNLWTDRDDFSDMVNGVWNQPVHGNPIYRFTTKLQLMRSTLRRYHNQTTSHISSRVADAKRKWIKGQTKIDARPRDPQLQAQERI
ncbi:endonuclease/exonuclease/phosphatase family protein [Salix suchowensis]|nr:endonuclease/exonuclease/phosphatase family protein [Salix suchowensis]